MFVEIIMKVTSPVTIPDDTALVARRCSRETFLFARLGNSVRYQLNCRNTIEQEWEATHPVGEAGQPLPSVMITAVAVDDRRRSRSAAVVAEWSPKPKRRRIAADAACACRVGVTTPGRTDAAAAARVRIVVLR